LLRPQILDDLGLEAALRWLARSFHDDHRIAVGLDFDEPFPAIDGDLATLIFRVTQESLSNIARHAGATNVEVGLRKRSIYLTLAIRDDGRGCDPQAAFAVSSEGRSSGLGGMRDRVRLFGGTLRLDSKIGEGATILAQFPLTSAAGIAP
jgi:signal transduction histidine kinase